MLPLLSPEQPGNPISELLSSAEALSEGAASRFVLVKLEGISARLRSDMRKFRSEMRQVSWALYSLLTDLGVKTPGEIEALILNTSDIEDLEEILSQAKYDTGHAGIEVVDHLPSIKSLANAFRSLEVLEREADYVMSVIRTGTARAMALTEATRAEVIEGLGLLAR